MKPQKEEWIESTLNSLDGISKAVPAAGFETRIMQRLQAERLRMIPDTVGTATIYRAAAAVLLIMTLNVMSCVIFQKNVHEKTGLTSVAKEFAIADSNDLLTNI